MDEQLGSQVRAAEEERTVCQARVLLVSTAPVDAAPKSVTFFGVCFNGKRIDGDGGRISVGLR